MKQHIVVLTLAYCLAEAALAKEPMNVSVPPGADARQQVLELGKEWMAAEDKHDEATLRRILDDKFIATFGTKPPLNKEAFIKEILSETLDPTQSQTVTDETAVVDRDTVVVVGTDTVRGTDNGAPYTLVFRCTVIYIHRHGEWIALAEHLVRVPPAK